MTIDSQPNKPRPEAWLPRLGLASLGLLAAALSCKSSYPLVFKHETSRWDFFNTTIHNIEPRGFLSPKHQFQHTCSQLTDWRMPTFNLKVSLEPGANSPGLPPLSMHHYEAVIYWPNCSSLYLGARGPLEQPLSWEFMSVGYSNE